MNQNLTNLLQGIVELLQNHGNRINALEREEFSEDMNDASLMEKATSLLAQLQIPESAEPIPSDQM